MSATPIAETVEELLDALSGGARLGRDAVARVCADWVRLNALLHTPELLDFAEAVRLEAAHQRERWDDTAKTDEDWYRTAGYLATEALDNPPKDGMSALDARLHRIVTVAALCANWHAEIMRKAGLRIPERPKNATLAAYPDRLDPAGLAAATRAVGRAMAGDAADPMELDETIAIAVLRAYQHRVTREIAAGGAA